MNVRQLTETHQTSVFDCGIPSLNAFLSRHALAYQQAGLSRTYILSLEDLPTTVIGYATLTFQTIQRADLPDGFKARIPKSAAIPIVLLGKFAIDNEYQSKSYGKAFLIEIIKIIAAFDVPFWGLIVDAIDDQALKFYLKCGFRKFNENNRCFLNKKDIDLIVQATNSN